MLRDPKLLVLLAAGSMTTMAGGVVAPVLPDIVKQLHVDRELAGILVSAHCLTIALFSPPLGLLADRIGKLAVLVGSLGIYALAGVTGAYLHDFWLLLATRGVLGAASGGIAAASLGLLGNLYEGAARTQAMGYATSALTLTGIAFPLLGGWVGAARWQSAFWLYALALPLGLLVCLVIGDSRQPLTAGRASAVRPGPTLSRILGQAQALQLLFTLGLSSVAMYAVVIYAPLYLQETIDADAALNGAVLAARAIGAALISVFGTAWLTQTLGTTRSIACGFGLMALSLATIPWLHQLNWILVTAVVFGLGFGLVLPNLYDALANLATPESRSGVLAAGTGAGFLGQFLSPIVLGPVLKFSNLEGVFYAAAGISLLAGLSLFSRQQIRARL